MFHKLAAGIMGQPGVCKHKCKMMLTEWPSTMMSGGPSVRMSGSLSVMIHGCLSVLMSESPSMRMVECLSMMMSESPSLRMLGRLSMMMSESPSMRMLGCLSMMMSESPSMRMLGCLSLLMSESPSMRMFGHLSVMMSKSQSMRMLGCLSMIKYGSPSMRMFGCLSMMSESPSMRMPGCLSMMSESPSMRMLGCLSVMKSESASLRMLGCLSMMMSESPSIRMLGCLSVMKSGSPSMRMFGCLSMIMSKSPSMRLLGCLSVMKYGSPQWMLSKGPSMGLFGCFWKFFRLPSIIFSERSSKKISGQPKIYDQSSTKISGQSSKKISEQSSKKISERFSKKITERFSKKISERFLKKISEQFLKKISGQSSKKISEQSSKKISGQSSKKISEQSSKKISGQSSKKISGQSSKKISEQSSKKISGQSSKKISEQSSKKISGQSSKKISGQFSKKITERFSKKISERFSKKISGQLSKKITERFSKNISEQFSKKIFERFSKKISGHNLLQEKLDGNLEYGTRCKQDVRIDQDSCCEKQKKEDLIDIIPIETSPPKRYAGLENQGSTCYLNTVLQMLFMTKEFRKAVKGYEPHNGTQNINDHIRELFESLKSGERTRAPATTERITAELNINVHKQEDAAKCLQKILNLVDSKISKIFQGTKVDTTICKTPAKQHKPLEQVETFFIISISLESQDHISLQSCFDSYFAPIIMCGEGQQVYCKDCEMMMDTETRSSLKKVPSVLVLHLERFEFDYDSMCCVKNHSSVEIPAQLSVKDESGDNHRYDLYAIANHYGSLLGGHYYADIRSFEDQQWYQFNDRSVHQHDLKGNLDEPLSSVEAYLLLYKNSASHPQTAEDEHNKMKEGTSSECENPANDETVTDNSKADVKSHNNANLVEQQVDEYPDVPESTTDHQHPSTPSEDRDHDPEINANTQQMVSDEESLKCTTYVSITSEIFNKIGNKIKTLCENKNSFWACIVFLLILFIYIIIFGCFIM